MTFRRYIVEIGPRGELMRVRCDSVYLLLRENDGKRLALGRMLTVNGNLSPVAALTNPRESDYRAYCHARGVAHRMQVQRYRVEGRTSPLAEGLRRFRSVVLKRLKAVCPEQEAGYLAMLLLDDKHTLSEDFHNLYQKNSIVHLLVISGLHTGLLGLTLYRLLRKRCGPSLSTAIMALFLCLYVALTGGNTGVFRSSLMPGLGFLALCFGRDYDPWSATAFTLLFLLFLSPLQLFQCGFQLSFLIVFSIGGPDKALTERLATKRGLCVAFLQSPAVFLIILSAISYWFFSLPPYDIFLNLLVTPMTGALLLLGSMLLAAAFAAPLLTLCYGRVLHLTLGMQILLCRFVKHLPFHRILLGWLKAWQLIAYNLCLSLSSQPLLDGESRPKEK